MNDIKIAEKTIRECFRNMSHNMRKQEAEWRAAKDKDHADWCFNNMMDSKLHTEHMITALSWAGFKITYTGYSKYFCKIAGDPHVAYVGFANRKEN